MKLSRVLLPLGFVLPLAVSCGSDDGDGSTDNQGAAGAAGATGAAGAPSTVETSYSCEICTCLESNPTRPAEIYEIVELLLDAIQGEGDPGNTYVGVMPNHQSGFWDIPNLGFTAAKGELGCLGDWHWPPAKTEPIETINQDQSDTLADWTAEDGDYDVANAVALSAKSATDLVDAIDATVDAGIPVITFDSDAVDSKRTLYLGALNEPAGELAATTVLDLVGTDFPGSSGVVAVLADDPSGANTAERIAGIQAAFDAAGAGTQLVIQTGLTDDDIAPTLDSVYAASGADFVGIVAVQGTYGAIVGDWLTTNSLVGEVHAVTWDTSDAVLAHMVDGTIEATMAQRAYFYGYLSTYVAYAMATVGVDATMAALASKLTGDDGDLLNTGMDVLTPDNLADYDTYASDCLGI